MASLWLPVLLLRFSGSKNRCNLDLWPTWPWTTSGWRNGTAESGADLTETPPTSVRGSGKTEKLSVPVEKLLCCWWWHWYWVTVISDVECSRWKQRNSSLSSSSTLSSSGTAAAVGGVSKTSLPPGEVGVVTWCRCVPAVVTPTDATPSDATPTGSRDCRAPPQRGQTGTVSEHSQRCADDVQSSSCTPCKHNKKFTTCLLTRFTPTVWQGLTELRSLSPCVQPGNEAVRGSWR